MLAAFDMLSMTLPGCNLDPMMMADSVTVVIAAAAAGAPPKNPGKGCGDTQAMCSQYS